MARRNKAQKNIKTDGRLTPFDVANPYTIDRLTASEREVRPPTPAEVHANNYAKVETGSRLGDMGEWVPLFKADLAEMNRCKLGRPYEYSNALILWLSLQMSFCNLDFRGTVGLFGGFLRAFGIVVPSYTRFLERSTELTSTYILDEDDPIRRRYGRGVFAVQCCGDVVDRIRRVGIDSTGISLSCHNMWRSKKWGEGTKDRGWLHFHVLCDVDSGEMLSYAITDSTIGDAPLLRLLISVATDGGHMFERVYADGAYCSNENWIYLCRDNGYDFVTSFKSNTRPLSNGCMARGVAAERWCSMPYHEWVRESGYGTRWKCECVFSDFKRLFPETVDAREVPGIVSEMDSRVKVFNIYKRTRAGLMHTTGNGMVIG